MPAPARLAWFRLALDKSALMTGGAGAVACRRDFVAVGAGGADYDSVLSNLGSIGCYLSFIFGTSSGKPEPMR
jgi:hypothetical protein